jgi:hypothetical protein
MAMYILCVLIACMIWAWRNGVWFTYFTHLNFALVCFYLLGHVWHRFFPSVRLSRALHLICEIEFTAALFLDGVFWTLLLPVADLDSEAAAFFNYNVHLGNWLIMLLDVALCRVSFVWPHLWVLLVFLLFYTAFTFIYFHYAGYWVYPFLDPTKQFYPVLLVGIFVFLGLCFAIGKLVVWARNKTAERLGVASFGESPRMSLEDDDSGHPHEQTPMVKKVPSSSRAESNVV